jgi:nicotinamide-nucleotide amidase
VNAEILAVGTELLMGQIANTNAQYISHRLPSVGVGVYYHSVVGDNPKRLKECLMIALERSDAVIMTGGLGPTEDDLTKETVAEAMGQKLVLHDESFEKLKAYFKGTSKPMAKNNIKQAYLPEDCIVIKNNNGTAPGCIIESGGKVVIMLPGPPSEMKPMLEETVLPYFREKADFTLISRHLRIFGIGESSMEERLIDLVKKQTNPTIAPYAKEGEVTLRITGRYDKGDENRDIITPLENEIKKRLGNAVYYSGEKEVSMEEVTGELLIKNNVTISLAESCTGGLLSRKLTDIPGISSVFNRAVVSYSNQSKVENLGVNPVTLEKFGAVSRQTAVEMAKGIRKISGTDLGVSVTGIAGPGGGTAEKPVGLVYVALDGCDGEYCRELKLWGNREKIRNVSTLHAMDIIRRYVLKLGFEG